MDSRSRAWFYSGLGLVLACGPAWAAGPACSLRDTSGMVALVICPAGLDAAGWRDAGLEACGARMPCGAWIWEDAAKAPERAPASHDGLRPAEVTAAVAVWVNEDQRLITIEPVAD